ncbi:MULTISPECIES: ATP-grasp ribosomal peptide maturase [Streptosporangium]|uniref:ATP-grasp ribosomal peptide maturase n=1 Tax=Streptosporangium brasiliense TaxID=47480 RepID=A0ABT9RLR2_9ACTN|nr:ATP-grasp ribosomal peptide maturase [Streptosporangium brasiliense]MDP9870224.1 ATP-grasp ribosomal peptide maturase [Streptosporangium brasiliense]
MLVITSAEDVTANLVIEVLNNHQVRVVRVDPADIGAGLVFSASIGDDREEWAGRLRTPSRDIALEEVGAVYYRRPTSYSTRFAHLPAVEQTFAAVEAQHGLGGILRSLRGAVYVNHPEAISRADYKPAQLQMAAQLGLTIPRTLITNDVEHARAFAAEHGPIIYKSFRGVPAGADGRRSAIWTQQVTSAELDDSVAVTAHLFQQEVPKTADARVTVIGRKMFGHRITSPGSGLDWRSGDWEQLAHEPIDVSESIKGALHAYLAVFGLVFGCFDFALDAAGGWTFIECNPNGQWAWLPDADAMAHAFAELILEGWWS